MDKPTRSYSNGEIVVEWRPGLCVHCEECVTGLPEVFNIRALPWVNMKSASTQIIQDQVAKCPNGALNWRKQEINE